MISPRELEKHFGYLKQEWLDCLLEIHNLVAELDPDAAVEMRHQGVVYYDASRGGPVSAGICQVLIKPDHLRLAFIHGAFLPDPRHLLRGKTFPKRYYPLPAYAEIPWEAVRGWIEAHSQFDPRSILVEGSSVLSNSRRTRT